MLINKTINTESAYTETWLALYIITVHKIHYSWRLGCQNQHIMYDLRSSVY